MMISQEIYEQRFAQQKQSEQALYRLLSQMQIPYEKNEHAPVFTTEEAEQLSTDLPGLKMKNLFVKDKKTGRFYLILLQDQRRLDFKEMKALTGWKSPTFASEEELWARLGLTPGSVTAFGLIHGQARDITVVLDQLIQASEPDMSINFHPCVNTATVAISLADFRRFLEYCGNPVLCENATQL